MEACPKCGKEQVKEGGRFCIQCGSSLETGEAAPRRCPCGAELPVQAAFCAECGALAKPNAGIDALARKVAVKKALSSKGVWGCLISMAVFGALMFATVGGAGVPASMKLAAPFVCGEDTQEAVVVVHQGSSPRGGTQISGELQCIDAEGVPRPASTVTVLLVLFMEALVVLMVLVLLRARGAPERARKRAERARGLLQRRQK